MIASLYMFATTALSVVGVAILGVAGQVESMEPYRGSYAIVTPLLRDGERVAGVAIGGFIAAGISHDELWAHEYGHVLQRKYYGISYVALVAIPSLLSAALRPERHATRWFEIEATEWGAANYLYNVTWR